MLSKTRRRPIFEVFWVGTVFLLSAETVPTDSYLSPQHGARDANIRLVGCRFARLSAKNRSRSVTLCTKQLAPFVVRLLNAW